MLPFYLLTVILGIGVAMLGSNAVDTAVQSAPVEHSHIYIIDAGHGGIDGGATSCTGVLESAINLQIALRLNDMMHFLGMDTVMIRTTDTSVYTEGNTVAAQKVSDLKERARIVNETQQGVLISIHQNTFSDSRYYGAQVFYAPTPGSRELADKLQHALCPQRRSKAGNNVYLLQHIERTGILIECGFLTNPQEEAKLRSDAYQIWLCAEIATGVIQWTVGS
jgi:N-acetylmuramoyl-L-alanine amidase